MSTLHGALSARLAIVSLCVVDHSTVRHTTSRQSREILDKFFLLFSHFGMMKIYPEGDTDLMAKKKWELLCRKNHMNLESNRITSECWLSPSWLPTMLVGLVRRPKTFYAIKLKKLNFEVRFSSSFSRDIYFFHDQLFFSSLVREFAVWEFWGCRGWCGCDGGGCKQRRSVMCHLTLMKVVEADGKLECPDDGRKLHR